MTTVSGATVLVTGGQRGLGKHLAHELLRADDSSRHFKAALSGPVEALNVSR
ncbi:MAG TPA: hypothetical protein VFT31_07395 [Kribbella sp.]|nr:hypothetical protein [Kribbella sp.]